LATAQALPPQRRQPSLTIVISFLANPARFMAISKPLTPVLGVVAAGLLAVGLWTGLHAPPDYQQGVTVRIMFVHVPAAITGMGAYAALGMASLFGLVWRHALADAAAKAAAPIGAVFTALGLVTGSLWGRPEWGTWWVWDARLTSFLILFLLYLAYMAVHAAFDDEQKGARMAAILGLVGLIMLPIVHYSVVWWNSLHQGSTILAAGGPTAPKVYLVPLACMSFGYLCLFATLWLARIRTEVWRRTALRAGGPTPIAPGAAAQAAQVG
jgi:heme exporter protein C